MNLFFVMGVQLCLRAQEESSTFSTHRLALTMLIKIVKSLGCAYGCGEGHRGLSGDRLRMQVGLASLARLTLAVGAVPPEVMRSTSCSDLS